MRWATTWRPAAAVALAVLLAGCAEQAGSARVPPVGTVADDATAEVQPEPSFRVDVVQYRSDIAPGVVQVKLTNDSPDPLTVRSVELRTSAFAPTGEQAKDSLVGPGRAVDLTVPLGEPRCGAEPVTAVVDIALDARAEPLTRDVGADLLKGLRERACAATELRARAGLELGSSWVRDDGATDEPALLGTLRLRVPADTQPPVTVDRVAPTTLFTVTADRLPLTLEAGERAEVVIRVQVLRCDAHARAEDKLGYFFPVVLAAGGDDPVPVLAAVDVADREPFERLLRDACRQADVVGTAGAGVGPPGGTLVP